MIVYKIIFVLYIKDDTEELKGDMKIVISTTSLRSSLLALSVMILKRERDKSRQTLLGVPSSNRSKARKEEEQPPVQVVMWCLFYLTKKVVAEGSNKKICQYGLRNGTCSERLTISPLAIMQLSVNYARLMKRMSASEGER